MKAFALSGRFYYITLNPGRCPGLGASALSGRAAKHLLVILDVALGKHVIRQGFQFSERHVLHGMLYLANQLVSLEIIVIAQARCKSIAHFFTLNFEC